jgi:hypothetical protein
MDQQVLLVNPDPQDQLDHQDQPETPVHLDHQDQREMQDQLDLMDSKDLQDLLAQQGLLDRVVQKVSLEHPVPTVSQAVSEWWASQAMQVPRDRRESRETLAVLDQLVQQDPLVNPDLLEILDQEDNQAHLELQDRLVEQDRVVHQVNQVQMVILVSPGMLEMLDLPVLKAAMDQQALAVILVRTETLVHLETPDRQGNKELEELMDNQVLQDHQEASDLWDLLDLPVRVVL